MSSSVYLSNPLGPSLLIAALCTIFLTSGGVKPAQASLCQYHQAYLESQANINHNNNHNNNQNNNPHNNLSPHLQSQQQQQQLQVAATTNGQQHQNLIVCPKASQYNNLPVQFASINTKLLASPSFERHQRDLLKSLNASFTNYLQLNGHQQLQPDQEPAASSNNPPQQQQVSGASSGQQALAAATSSSTTTTTGNEQNFAASDLIDDELLNEIISPLVVDEAYVRAKELIVKRRKLESELIKQGEY